VAGVAVAYWSFRTLLSALPAALARSMSPVFDARVFVFAALAALAAALMASLLPAWRLSRAEPQTGLQPGRLYTPRFASGPKSLLSIEVGFALISIVAALMLTGSLWTIVSRELGFETERLVISARSVGAGAAARGRDARLVEFTQQLEAIRSVSGTRSAAGTSGLPAGGVMADFGLFPRGQGRGGVWMISGGFFKTMGIRVVEGREFEDRESFEGAPIGILNQSAARLLFPGVSAIGRQVAAPRQPARTIVGVVADSRRSWKEAAEPSMYVPFDRAQFRLAQIVVDADDTPAMRERLRGAITRVAPDSDVVIEPFAALLDRDVAVLRFTMRVIVAFALLTLALAMVGVYGVITFIAAQRQREYGVRVALGATRRAIAVLVLRQALAPVVAGVLGGLIAGLWTARMLTSQIADVSPATMGTFAGAAVALLACGAVAAGVPARRATRVDPLTTLRA
jgi:predicted permease